jgi:GDP-L-fucose synthase
MNKNSKIYIAGHKGLVGSALLRKLESEGYENLIIQSHQDLDLMRQADVEAFFKSKKPEYVFLAAAKVGGIWANNSFPADFIYSNLMVQSNVIHAAHKSSVKKLLFLGSSCIYPRECPQPMKEEYLLSGKLEPTNEPYAIAKIAGIKMCQAYNRQHGTNFVSVMPTNLYGPGDNFDLETSHVLAALIRKFHEAKLRIAKLPEVGGSRPEANSNTSSEALLKQSAPQAKRSSSINAVTIWGTGKPMREFLYVDDLADACLFVMEHYDQSDIINIGAGKDIGIGELAGMIKEIVDFKGGMIFDTTKPDGMPKKLLDSSKMTNLGWKPEISLRDGIRQTYEWCVESSIF